jgi:hypothetical protein
MHSSPGLLSKGICQRGGDYLYGASGRQHCSDGVQGLIIEVPLLQILSHEKAFLFAFRIIVAHAHPWMFIRKAIQNSYLSIQ